MSEPQFFAFHPRRARALLLLAALGCLASAVWALYGFGSAGHLVEARAGIAVGLFLACAYVRHRLRPRKGWGVFLTSRGLLASRPLSGEATEVPWASVRLVRRGGKRRDVLLLLLDGERRLLLPGHLFPSAKAFEQLAAAVEERAPVPPYDA